MTSANGHVTDAGPRRSGLPSTTTIIGAIAGAVAVAGWVGGPFRRWVEDRNLLSWIALALVVIVVALWEVYVRTARERTVLRSRVLALDATPRAGDQDEFSQLVRHLDMRGRMMRLLEQRFTAKQWRDDDFDDLDRFLTTWRHQFFVDETVDAAFRDLYAAGADLSDWLGGEGFINWESDGASQIVIPTPSEREYEADPNAAYQRIRNDGVRLASQFVQARLNLEKVGRHRGLTVQQSSDGEQAGH